MIHIETETLRETGVKMAYRIEEMWDYAHHLYRLAEQLDMSWNGCPSAEETVYNLRRLAQRLDQDLVQLDGLSYRMVSQSNAWEENDLDWARRYRALGSMGS